jgi:CRP-like cAMP-binding protein
MLDHIRWANPIDEKAFVPRDIPRDIPRNIIDQFLQSEIKVQCPEILRGLLKQYPEEPSLLKMYADLLNKSDVANASHKIYQKAAKIFLDKGRIIRAVAAKLAQWQICTPDHNEVIEFIMDLQKSSRGEKALNRFLRELKPEEAAALLSEFELSQFNSKSVIKSAGDLEDRLYFVVSGTLKDSLFLAIDNNEKLYRTPTAYLSEEDYFGNVYPFDQATECRSQIESTSKVELISISKGNLTQICKNYPSIERQLIELLQIRAFNSVGNQPKRLRSEKRIKLHLNFGLEIILKTNAHTSIYVTGYSNDVSIGGICLILDEISLSSASEIPTFEKFFDRAEVRVSLQIENLTLQLPGKIQWSRKVFQNSRTSMAIGIQFSEISPRLRGLLLAFFNCFDNC